MKIGMYSVEIRRPSVSDLFKAIREKGFSEVQFNLASVCAEQMPASVEPGLLQAVSAAAGQNGVEIVAVNGTYNMIHPDAAQRAEGLKRFEAIARACKVLCCRFVTICTGSRDPRNMWRFHEDNNTLDAWKDMLDSMEKALEVAERYDLLLGMECEASNTVSSAKKARKVLDELRSDRLKIIMDVANLFQRGEAKREYVRPIMDEAFALLGEATYLAHGKDIQEGEGLSFTHAGSGIVDFPYFLQKLEACGYNGGMLLHGIKVEEQFEPSVNFIRDIISKHRH